MREYLRFSLILFLICFFTAFSLSLVNRITQPKILAQLEKEQQLALHEVVPQAFRFEPIKKDGEIHYYKAFDKDGNLLGYAFKTETKGYSSNILTMVGIKPDGKIISIKILSHNETPGIGSKITEIKTTQTLWDKFTKKPQETKEEPWFCEQFKGKDVRNLEKEIEAISGATISSEAVIKSVKEKAELLLKEIYGK